jgi:copine 1/2/3
VKLHCYAESLDKKDFFGKSDPYFVIERQVGNGKVSAFRSEVIKNTLNPGWKPFQLPLNQLCGSTPTTPMLITVFDWDNDGSSDYIGEFTATLAQLQECAQKRTAFSVINKSKEGKKGYRSSGNFFVRVCDVVQCKSFLDYIAAVRSHESHSNR